MNIRIDDLQKTIILLLSNIKESVGDVVEIKKVIFLGMYILKNYTIHTNNQNN